MIARPARRCYPDPVPPLRIRITGFDGFVGRRRQAGLTAAGHAVVGTVFREPPGGPHEVSADITATEMPAALAGPFEALVDSAVAALVAGRGNRVPDCSSPWPLEACDSSR